jgi:hypothetical protein
MVSRTSYEDLGAITGQKKKPLRQVWHYWLCGPCSSTMTLQFDQVKGLQVTPLEPVGLTHDCTRLAS